MEAGDISDIIESTNHYFVFTLLSKDIFDENSYFAVKDSIRNDMLINKQNQTFNNWLRIEKHNIEIIDLRHKIF